MNRRILNLAIPNIISNLSVPLLGAVDTALIGHLDKVYYLGALAVGSMIFNFLFWGFGFLRMGTTGMTAQAYGEENESEMIALLARAAGLALVAGILLILLQWPIAKISFWLVGASPEVESYTRIYFQIRIFSAPATLALYAFNGWFLGMQNARFPMVVTVFLNLLNVGLDVFFIYGLGMNVDGAAWGTLLARYAGVALAAGLWVYRYRHLLDALQQHWWKHVEALRRFFSVNRDIFIRTLCLIFTFSFFTAKSAEAGDVVLGANTILLQMWMIVSYGVDGFAFAAESLVGRYQGGRNFDQLQKAIGYCLAWGMGLGLLVSVVYGLFEASLLHLFTDQQPVLEAARRVYGWTIAAPFISSFSFIWDGVFIGATATVPMRNTLIVATGLLFLPAYYLGNPLLGVHGLWLAMTLFMLARGLLLTFYAPKYHFIPNEII